jgi:predicted RNase H-like nuclease (RuvC/YqgF family)
MVDQIQNRISEISEKVGLLVQALSALKIENQNLAEELQSKENELTSLSNKHKQDLESTIMATKQNVTESSSKNLEEKNKEIDTLVKEIEICIQELKK